MPEVSKTLISRWGSDSHIRGSYTFVPDGVDGVKAHKALASPLPPKDKCRGRKVHTSTSIHTSTCNILSTVYITKYSRI